MFGEGAGGVSGLCAVLALGQSDVKCRRGSSRSTQHVVWGRARDPGVQEVRRTGVLRCGSSRHAKRKACEAKMKISRTREQCKAKAAQRECVHRVHTGCALQQTLGRGRVTLGWGLNGPCPPSLMMN